VSKCVGIVLSVGHSVQNMFSGQLADTAPIAHTIDGQFSYPVAPRLEKAGTIRYIFSYYAAGVPEGTLGAVSLHYFSRKLKKSGGFNGVKTCSCCE